MTWKILHSESSLGWGGQERRILLDMEAMRKRGSEVHLVCDPKSTIAVRAAEKKFVVHRISLHRWFHPLTQLRLLSLLQIEKFDLIHAHSSGDSWALGVAAHCFGARRPRIVRTRHLSTPIGSSFVYTRLADRIITTGQSIRDLLVRAGVNAAAVISIPSGVDMSVYVAAATDREKFRKEIGANAGTVLVGNVAVLRSWKGHDDFLDAAKKIHAACPQTLFVLAGDGPQRARLEERVRQEGMAAFVRFLGTRQDIPHVLAGLDIFLFCSYANEGVPQAVGQALAMGKPVVSTRLGGVEELVVDGKTGLLVAPRDVEAMSAKVLSLISDTQRAKTLGEAGKAHVRENFSLEIMENAMVNLYGELLGEIRDMTPFSSLNGDRVPVFPHLKLGSHTRPVIGDTLPIYKAKWGYVPNYRGMSPISRLRIALIRQKVSPHGGAESVVHRCAADFAARGHEVHVVATDWEAPHSNVTYHRIPMRGKGAVMKVLSFQCGVQKFLLENHFDIVHGFDRNYPVDVYRAGDGSHRAWLSHAARPLAWLQPKNWALLWLESRMLADKNLKKVIANSNMVREELIRHHGLATDKVVVVYNGIDASACRPPETREERARAKRALGLAESDTVLLFMGSNYHRKGLAFAIEALAACRRDGRILLVAGKGKEKHYRSLVRSHGLEKNVRFLGEVKDTESLYRASDLLILPTLYDPFSNVCLEAMAYGMPVLTTPTNGASEIVQEGKTGWIATPPNTKIALGKALESDLWQMGRNALQKVQEHSFISMADQILKVYASCIKPTPVSKNL